MDLYRRQGLSLRDIAASAGVSRQTIARLGGTGAGAGIAPDPADERARLTSAPSLGAVVAGQVDDFTPVPVADVFPTASAVFELPKDWLLAAPGQQLDQPMRVVVTGHRSRGGWEGCATLAAFAFTGSPATDIIVAHAACTLHDLQAAAVTVQMLPLPPVPGSCAIRSSGYVTAAGLRLCAQLSTYVVGSEAAGCGRLFEHSVFVTSQRRTALHPDTQQLSQAVHDAVHGLLVAHK
jgi:hypothetical protein